MHFYALEGGIKIKHKIAETVCAITVARAAPAVLKLKMQIII